MKVDLRVGVWFPNGEAPVVWHVDGILGHGQAPKVRLVSDQREALVLDLRPARRALNLLRPATRVEVRDASSGGRVTDA